MSKWFFINIIVLLYAIWKISTNYYGIHMLVGGIGLLFILYNWTRHAVFSTIRSDIPRQKKIVFAKLSKKALPIHKWTGTSAFLIVLIHATLVLLRFGFQAYYIKMWSGFFALTILGLVVITGWMRWYRTTVKRRYIHWTLGFILFAALLIHIIF